MADPVTASSVVATYSELLQSHPIATKSSTAAVLSCLGDAIAQYGAAVNNKQEEFEYDTKRGAAFFAFGGLYTGFFQHFWFRYLNAHIMVSDTSGLPWDAPTLTAASKVVINQCCAIAGLYMPTFFVLTAWLGDMSANEGWDRAKTMYAPLVLRNWTFWFPTQFVQFSVIPDAWHIPYLSVMSLIWTVILSTLGNVSSKPPQPQQQLPAAATSSATAVLPPQSEAEGMFSTIQNGLPTMVSTEPTSRLAFTQQQQSFQEEQQNERSLVPLRQRRR